MNSAQHPKYLPADPNIPILVRVPAPVPTPAPAAVSTFRPSAAPLGDMRGRESEETSVVDSSSPEGLRLPYAGRVSLV